MRSERSSDQSTNADERIEDGLLALLEEHGAVGVGFATREQLEGSPPSADITYVMQSAQTAVSIAVPFDRTAIQKFLSKTDRMAHNDDQIETYGQVAFLAEMAANFLRDHGYEAIAVAPQAQPRMEEPNWIYDPHPPLSHRYISVAAGVTTFGWSGNVGMVGHGTAILLATCVTDALLTPSPQIPDDEGFCDNCKMCAASCPTSYFEKHRSTFVTIGRREHKYAARNHISRCYVSCTGITGLHPSGTWGSWAPGRFAMPEDDGDAVEECERQAALQKQRPLEPADHQRWPVDLGPGHVLTGIVTDVSCGFCQLVCVGDHRERASLFRQIMRAGVPVQYPDGTFEILPADKAVEALESMPLEHRLLYEDVEQINHSPLQKRPHVELAKARVSFHRLSVESVTDETQDVRSITFALPRELEEVFEFDAGQFLTFQVPREGAAPVTRCYSLSTAPEDRQLRITVKRVPDGIASNWFHDHVSPGDTISVLPPSGRFTLRDTDEPLLLVAGGSGITAVWSLARSALMSTERSVKLLYAVQDPTSVIHRAEIDAMQEEFPQRLSVHLHFDEEAGYLDPERLTELTKGWADADVYVCGPSSFMDFVFDALSIAGVPEERIKIERFMSPIASEERASELQVGPVPSSITVRLDGLERSIPYTRGMNLLAAARSAGLDPPAACEAGVCGTCKASVEGRVVLPESEGLTQEESDAGLTLTCQALPLGELCKVSYDDDTKAPSTFLVDWYGTSYEIENRRGRSILHSTREAGLNVPFACESGICGACVGKVVAGQVKMRVNRSYLTDDEIAEGWVLTCQSRPLDDEVEVRFVEEPSNPEPPPKPKRLDIGAAGHPYAPKPTTPDT